MNPRQTALDALIACRKEGAWPNAVLKSYIRRDRLDSRDAALATRLCYGVLQNRQRLDFYLDQLLTGRRKDLHPAIRDILHLGLYQLRDMDKIPPSAAVNESVALAKRYGPGVKAAGLVNGVLRSALRQEKELKEPVSYAQKYSHPDPLIALLKQNLPKGTLEPMLMADNAAPATVIQVNTLKTDTLSLLRALADQGVSARPHSWMAECLVLSGTGNLERLKAFQEGLFYVQDPAARLSVLCADLPEAPIRILDCCGAPGGKSFAAAIATGGKAAITTCDIHPHKIRLIEEGARRLGLSNITAQVQDAAVFLPEWEGAMDVVIADVPCSGLGIIAKKPDIRYKNLEDTLRLPPLQKKILENQSRYVKPGGKLIYSTCTLLKRENQDVVTAFLAEHPDFFLEGLPLPAPFAPAETGMYTLIPGQYDTDGFFISRLGRRP